LKNCLKCNQTKILDDFNKRTRNKDGFENHCKECTKAEKRSVRVRDVEKAREYGRLWRQRNPERAKAINKRTYEANKEKILEQQKKYYENNKEKFADNAKEYRKNNFDVLKAKRKEYVDKNRKSVSEGIKRWVKANPDKMKVIRKTTQAKRKTCPIQNMMHRIRTQTRMALIGECGGKLFKSRLGCAPSDFRSMFNLFEGFTVDHICPLSQAKTVDEVIKLAHYSNVRVVTLQENMEKRNNKTPEGESLCQALLRREWI